MPDEVAPLVAFLAGPGAIWINGQNIRINGVSVIHMQPSYVASMIRGLTRDWYAGFHRLILRTVARLMDGSDSVIGRLVVVPYYLYILTLKSPSSLPRQSRPDFNRASEGSSV